MVCINTKEFLQLLVDCSSKCTKVRKYVQISQLNKIPKIKDIFKTVKDSLDLTGISQISSTAPCYYLAITLACTFT